MPRLIDADALKAWIDCGRLRPPTEMCFSELDVVRMLDKQPTIDAEPVRHGHWIYRVYHFGDEYYTCSACGEDWFIPDGTPAENHMHFCPVCGAKMDLEVQDG